MTVPSPVVDAFVADRLTSKWTSCPAVTFREASGVGAIEVTNPPSSAVTNRVAWVYNT